MKSKSKTIIAVFLVIALAAGAYYSFAGFSRKKAKAASPSMSYQVKRGSIQSTVSAIGTIAAGDSRDITVPAGSTVSSVNCTEGQSVKNGDVLFTLTNESAELDLKKSKLNVSQLQTQLNSLNSQQADLTVYAPTSGIIKSVSVNTGDSTGSQGGGQYSPIQIEDTSAMRFSIYSSAAGQDKQLFDSLVPNQTVGITIAGLSGTRQAKVLSVTSTQQGNNITFQVIGTSGLNWDNYYSVTFMFSGKDVVLNAPVQFAGIPIVLAGRHSAYDITRFHLNVKYHSVNWSFYCQAVNHTLLVIYIKLC
jgi:multidrug efflux pump subunit AcrA (membrane-fusion protein)